MVNAFRWMVFVIGLAVVIGSIMVTSAGNPIIVINSPSNGDTVYTNEITVSGSAMGTDGAVVESVKVNEGLADGTTSWRKDISLQPGLNVITVEAKDNMNQSRLKTISVTYIAPTTTTISEGGYRITPITTATSTPIPMPTGSISITTIPSGAEVYLDYSDSSEGITPITLENVTVGHHKVKVSKEGYRSETRKIYLYTGKTRELNIKLKPITGSIVVYSTPPGASVYLDGDDMNKITPCMLSEVVVGQHTIKLTKTDYFDVVIKNVSVSAGRTTHLHENLTKCPRYGSIDIFSDPSGAKVYLDDDYMNDTPCMLSEVVVGPHTLKLTKFGYDDEIRNVSVSVGETLYLNENLTGYGSLIISSNPSGASVCVDGVYKGKTLLDIPKVVVGSYSIGLTKLGYGEVEKPIHVSAGETTYEDVHFSSGMPPIFELILILLTVIFGSIAIIPIIVKRIHRNPPPQRPN